MAIPRFVRNIWSLVYTVQGLILFVLIMGVTILMFVQVILRYVLQVPLMGIEELILFPAIWLYLLGGANASMEKKHIECNVVSVYIKNPFKLQWLKIIKSAISLAICLWLTYWAYEYFLYSLKVWKLSNMLYIPLFIGESALFICLVLMAIYTTVELGQYVLGLKTMLQEKRG
ncbi:MAG: TRAP transporter small permease subunit [Synergistales bacterium]|nr:TRAP transporter small permease subunit [Synergistales bacterium]